MPSPHLHVVPRNDQIGHRVEDDGECVCGPREEYVDTKDVTGWLVIHNSLDGREVTEQLADLLEKNMLESAERVAADVSKHLGIAPIAAEMRAALQAPIRQAAEGLADAVAAGDSPIEFAQRLAAQCQRVIEES